MRRVIASTSISDLKKRLARPGVLVMLIVGAAVSAGTVALPSGSVAHAAETLQPLEIDTATGPHRFQVEVARTDADRARGLMYRRSMPKNHGMLFDFQSEQPVTFWMENTYIPLDMIFVDQKGRVVSIKQDAKPMDRSLIPSGAPALGVVELNAGVAQAIGLKVGDTVVNPLFHR